MGLDALPGNAAVKHVLRRYRERRMIPSSMIFAGPDSCDKLGFALAFAQELNCLKPQHDNQPGAGELCKNCRAIARGLFPDVQVLEPEGQFYRKAQIDELIEISSRKPILAEKRVSILNEAKKMNESAANAFLKTLEEPVPSSVFILLTANVNLLLPTIRSRCQLLKFVPLSEAEYRQELVQRGLSAEQARVLFAFGKSLNEGFSQSTWNELLEKRQGGVRILQRLLAQDEVEDVLLDLYDRSRNRDTFIPYFRELINLLSLLLRDIMILWIESDLSAIINFDMKERLMDLKSCLTREKLFALIRKMELLLRDVQRNLNSRVIILEFINSFAAGEFNNG